MAKRMQILNPTKELRHRLGRFREAAQEWDAWVADGRPGEPPVIARRRMEAEAVRVAHIIARLETP